MDIVVRITFWVALFLLFYSYIGYGLILLLLQIFKKQKVVSPPASGSYPTITLIIAGYNEGPVLDEKLQNSLQLHYPVDKLSILFVSDGSADETSAIMDRYPQVTYIEKPVREGKSAALNTAMNYVKSEIVVFSDANGMLNKDCLYYIARHFLDEKTGAVAGEKKVYAPGGAGSPEGLYWQYESILKKLDARFYTVLSATGELFAMRTALFKPLDQDTILDDFVLSLTILTRGYTIAYEPDAYSVEASSASLKEEEKRKVRIAAGAFQVLKGMPWRKINANYKLLFQFFSRRWLRWVICPIVILAVFLLNILLFSSGTLYQVLLWCQVVFYLFALIGYLLTKQQRSLFLFTVPFYFLFMNYCMFRGYLLHRQRRQTVLWEKAKRQV